MLRSNEIKPEEFSFISKSPKGPHIQYLWVKALMMTGSPMVVIIHRSEKARFTTNMLEGVRKDLTWEDLYECYVRDDIVNIQCQQC